MVKYKSDNREIIRYSPYAFSKKLFGIQTEEIKNLNSEKRMYLFKNI